MTWYDKLNNIDPRYLYIVLSLVLVIPIFKPVGMPVAITESMTRPAYELLESLPEDSLVIFDQAYGPSWDSEVTPMLKAVFRQLARKKVKIVSIAQVSSGDTLTRPVLDFLANECGYEYGVDWVNIGYRPGGSSIFRLYTEDFWTGATNVDVNGTPLSELPLMQRLPKFTAEYVDAIVVFESTNPGFTTWITWAPGIPMVKASIAPEIGSTVRYLQAKQLTGLIPGLRGAAEYEKLIDHPDSATQLMDAQSLSHLTMIFLIVLGNVGWLMSRRASK